MDRKNVPVSMVNAIDSADGIVEAIVSVTNVVDSVNDVIEPGAYKNTLRKRNPKGVWSHDTNIPVAKTLKVEELMPNDPRLPEDLRQQNAGALLVKMQFNLNTSRGRDAFYDVQFFAEEQEWSIGYSVPEGKSTTDEKTGVRFIKALELYEYSPVIFGAAPNTRTLSVKDDVDIETNEEELYDEFDDFNESKAGDYSDLNFSIPDGVKKQAEIGLKWSREYNRGGTSVGKNTANYLTNNNIAAPRKVRHIAKYFPRHEVDLRTPANSRPGADGYPGAGLIAWKLWGGDAGRTWSTKLVEAMNRRDEKNANIEKDVYTDMPEGNPGSFGTPYRPGVVGRPGARRPRRRRPAEGKPYRISSNMSGCSGYAVVKEGEDSPVPGGCHETLAEARRHMSALYAAEKAEFQTLEQKHIGHRFLLSAEEAALHESLLQIATVYGKFDEDGDGIWAGYDSPAENDVKDIGVKCSNCTLYKGDGVCSIIKQTVQEEGKCRFAVIPDGVVQLDGVKSYAEAITEWEESEEGVDWEAIESKAGGPIRSHSTAVRDDTPINRSAILAVRSPEKPSYYRNIFAYQLPNTDGTRKTHYTFIHHHISKDGQAGAAAMGELRVQMSVLNGARGGTILRGSDRKAVYNHLAKHYRDGGFEVPSLKSDHEVDNLMIKAGHIAEPLTKEEVND